MNEKQYLLIWFTIFFILPMAYQRTMFFFNRERFLKMELRQKTGLQIHHGHWGVFLLLIAQILSLIIWVQGFPPINFFTVLISGLGWGLLLDEIAPHLMTKDEKIDRRAELEVYQKSLLPTIAIFSYIIIILAILIFKTRVP